MTGAEVLAVPMQANDAGPGDSGAATIRDYLTRLLTVLWQEGEGFSGKRPFGNSGWEYDLYRALGGAGAVAITYDKWGGIETVDTATADRLIFAAIDALGAA